MLPTAKIAVVRTLPPGMYDSQSEQKISANEKILTAARVTMKTLKERNSFIERNEVSGDDRHPKSAIDASHLGHARLYFLVH